MAFLAVYSQVHNQAHSGCQEMNEWMSGHFLSNTLTEGSTEKFIQHMNVLSAVVRATLIALNIICAPEILF